MGRLKKLLLAGLISLTSLIPVYYIHKNENFMKETAALVISNNTFPDSSFFQNGKLVRVYGLDLNGIISKETGNPYDLHLRVSLVNNRLEDLTAVAKAQLTEDYIKKRNLEEKIRKLGIEDNPVVFESFRYRYGRLFNNTTSYQSPILDSLFSEGKFDKLKSYLFRFRDSVKR